MGRSKESLKRKRSSRSKDSGYYVKRRSTCTMYTTKSPEYHKISQSSTDSLLQSFYEVVTYDQVPYYSWLTYFYDQEYNEKSPTVAKINALIEFFENNVSGTFDVESGLNLDINLCISDFTLLKKWSNIVENINANPQHILNCISVAFVEVMMGRAIKDEMGNIEQVFRIMRLNQTNIINCESLNPLPYVKLSSYGKLISISGSVIAVGLKKLGSDSIVFICKCNRQILSKPRNETTLKPRKCRVCGNARIKRLLDSPYEATKVSQTICIKDYRAIDQIVDDGTILPNIISVKLMSGLVDKYLPGDKIRIIGIPRVTLGAVKSSISGSYPLYVDAISAFPDDDRTYENSMARITIEKIKSESDVLSLLVHSLCPTVQGHEILKASLVLSLFAGTFKCEEIRDYIHILIIGNLGLGKSQLLRACAHVAPEGTYIRGNSTISLESTMINVRENATEDYRFEADPLALANRGLCCLDELDKMSNQHQIIYNAMVRQRVDMINSELKVHLPARTSIFAMTNSIKKRYDTARTVVENVNATRPLLSQFDLIFVMRDFPDTYLDKLMCDRVLDVHAKRTHLIQQTFSSDCRKMNASVSNVDQTLRERLIRRHELRLDILPEKIFRVYVNYARSFVKPKFSSSSRAIIERFCLLCHQKERDFMKVERLLLTLVILTEARAKIDLRHETTEQDAFDAIEILESSILMDTKDRSQSSAANNPNKLTANKVKQFLEDLRNESTILNKTTFTHEELKNIAGQENVAGNTLSMLLSKLNDQEPDSIQLQETVMGNILSNLTDQGFQIRSKLFFSNMQS